MTSLQPPFPWMGGKRRAAPMVWRALGDVSNYIEPFAGALAVLLGRPLVRGNETVNDVDGFISNFWRAVAADADAVADEANWPLNENDLHARHAWLVTERVTLAAKLEGDPYYYDARIAGWWVWGTCCWIGGGWCSGDGKWASEDGYLVPSKNREDGISRQLPFLGNGRGVHRKLDAAIIKLQFKSLQHRLRRVRVCCGDWQRICGLGLLEVLGADRCFP